MNIIRKIQALKRANDSRIKINQYYDDLVWNCAAVSAANKTLAFVVRRCGLLGYPVLDQIRRPDCVSIHESDDCAVIKDGVIYEMRTKS